MINKLKRPILVRQPFGSIDKRKGETRKFKYFKIEPNSKIDMHMNIAKLKKKPILKRSIQFRMAHEDDGQRVIEKIENLTINDKYWCQLFTVDDIEDF